MFSAVGMVVADHAVSVQSGLLSLLADVAPAELDRRYAALEQEARALLGVSDADVPVRIARSAAMRYELQEWELRVILPDVELDADAPVALANAFHDAHMNRFQFARAEKPVELVTLYLEATVAGPGVAYEPTRSTTAAGGDALTGTRRVWVGGDQGATECPVYTRDRLGVGATIDGPCVVEESSATISSNRTGRASSTRSATSSPDGRRQRHEH